VDFWDVDRVASIILDLVQDAPKRAEIAQRAIQEVAGLRWEEAARKISDVYAEVTRPSTCST
jgi:hypothetical protein